MTLIKHQGLGTIKLMIIQQAWIENSSSRSNVHVKAREIEVLIIYLHVDNLIYAMNSVALMKDFKRLMINEFEITDLDLMSYFLGLAVQQNGVGIFLFQEKYVHRLHERF